VAGSPKKRQRREREAVKRLEIISKVKAEKRARKLPRRKYSPDIAREIVNLIASGVPIVDSTLMGVVIDKGVASQLKIHPSTIYEWQNQHPELAENIARARVESAHQLADRMLALANVALRDPVMANSVRVAGDILKWSAEVRNRFAYGESKRIELHATSELAERLRRARARTGQADGLRVIEGQGGALLAPEAEDVPAVAVADPVKEAA